METERCSRILNEERQKYVQRLKEKLMSLPKGSKQWWKINRELLNKKGKVSSIPSLKNEKTWITEAKAKADTFARSFSEKAALPPEVVDVPFFGIPDEEFNSFVSFRTRVCKRLFKKLGKEMDEKDMKSKTIRLATTISYHDLENKKR